MRLVKGLVGRCVDVTGLLAAADGPRRLSEIAARLDLPKSATHRLLTELSASGWVEQVGTEGPYRLTLRFGLLGAGVLRATGLAEMAEPVLARVAATTAELVRMTVRTDDGLAWALAAQGASGGLIFQPRMDGRPVLHATANGKAYLATLPDRMAIAIAQQAGLGTIAPGPRTLRDAGSLLADLATVRARGFATAIEEGEPGVTAVAVVIQPEGDPVVGTISVAGPSVRLVPDRHAAVAAVLSDAAATLAAAWPLDPPQRKVARS